MSDPGRAVFLSYASQDAEAARRIAEALRSAGVEVWFDQSELVGGDAWDHKIRDQIKACAFFVPVISANTNARLEGYFRREWRMAVERMHDMDDDMPFLVPVVIDDTSDAAARVPERFRERQWTRLPGGETSRAFVDRMSALLAGEVVPTSSRPARSEVGRRPARRERGSPWLTVFFIVIGLGTGAYYSVILPWLNRHENNAPTATPPPSEADQLIRQARELLYDPNAARHEFALADNLIKRATDLAPTSAAAWGASSLVNFYTFFRAYDTNRDRVVQSRTEAEKSLVLDPRTVDALLALGLHRQEQGEPDRAKELFERALAVDPQNSRVLLAQGLLIQDRGASTEFLLEAAARARQPAELLLYAAINLSQSRRFGEAIPILERSLAAQPVWRTYVVRAYTEYMQSADPARVIPWLERVPDLRSDEPRVAVMRFKAEMLRRDGAAAERALSPLAGEFIEDNYFIGPKAFLLAQAHELVGHAARASEQWEAAERSVREQTAAEPGNIYWRAMLAVILTGEKRFSEARIAAEACASDDRIAVSRAGSRVLDQMVAAELTALAFVRLGDGARAIELLRRAPYRTAWGYVSAATLGADPAWAPLHGQPGYAELVTEMKRAERQDVVAREPDRLSTLRAASDSKSVAVLAFANLSDDKGNEYFSDGISEELLNVLASVSGLTVKGRSSSFFFKGRNTPVPEIAQQLGVAYIVQGSVRKAGNRVRISAQLIHAASDEVVWSSGSLDRDLQDIFAVQDEIAGLVAQQLQLKLGVSKPARVVDPEAHRLLLEARYYWHQRGEQNFDKTETLLNRALAIDSEFAPAHAALADLWVMRAAYRSMEGTVDLSAEFRSLHASAARAIELDPSLVAPLAARAYGLLMEGRMEASRKQFEAAVALNPNDPTVRFWRALFLMESGDFKAAYQEFAHARELDPKAWIIAHLSGHNAFELGRLDEALALVRQANVDRTERFAPAVGYESLVLWQSGRVDEAIAAARAVRQSWPKEPRWHADAHALWILRKAGLEKEVAEYSEALLAGLSAQTYQRGFVLAALGRFDEALPYLERTNTLSLDAFAWLAIFDPWREDPRFKALIEKLHWSAQYARAREAMNQVAGAAAKP